MVGIGFDMLDLVQSSWYWFAMLGVWFKLVGIGLDMLDLVLIHLGNDPVLTVDWFCLFCFSLD
jgi:hypothetical protein